VASVAGTVVDRVTGQPLDAAVVSVVDATGLAFRTKTDAAGGFVLRSTPAEQIVPGNLTITVDKPGYELLSSVVAAPDGGAVGGIQLSAVRAAAAAAPSPAGAGPSDQAAAPTAAATPGIDPANRLVLIIGAGLAAVAIVAATAGTIALVVSARRRRRAERFARYLPAYPAARRDGEGLDLLLS
jgi:hypothetical protein